MTHDDAQVELEAVLNTIVDGVIIINDRGVMQLFNPACEKMFGYKPDEVIGKNVKTLMPDPYTTEHDGYIQNYLNTKTRKIIGIGREVRGRRQDGTTFPMHLSVGEAKIATRTIFVGIIHDLTRRQEESEKFENLQQKHFHLSRVSAMNEMGSAIAHELNQPMTATINYLEAGKVMLDQNNALDVEKLKSVMDRAVDQTKRASEIISRMRSFIRTGDLDKKPVELEICLKTAVELALMPFKTVGIKCTYDISRDIPEIYVNSIQIQQVVVNLVKNACEAMLESDTKELHISAKRHDDSAFVEIGVADSGQGIDQEQQEHLFTPFTSSKKDGMGIGLSISESIISNHGGRIWADINEPLGTRFCFTLPISTGDD
ncbi:MAG: PAS domain-containing sensor histidine kinase [Acidimicrobiales bacterium]|nr:PAS domain S-box protein [Hyphomonadaceae bacterium]RZV43948.1 MAG: PAS domain-containing sensor histidine kinase [Acidimicrobiales bacterium]